MARINASCHFVFSSVRRTASNADCQRAATSCSVLSPNTAIRRSRTCSVFFLTSGGGGETLLTGLGISSGCGESLKDGVSKLPGL